MSIDGWPKQIKIFAAMLFTTLMLVAVKMYLYKQNSKSKVRRFLDVYFY
jgi:hypothetical protein